MKIIIISVISSSVISIGISHWYLKQMTMRTQMMTDDFFSKYEKEYREFLLELRKDHN